MPITPASFSPELLATMRSVLDVAVRRIDHSGPTPAIKARMAQRIVAMASAGVTDPHALMNGAVDEGRVSLE